MTTVEKWRNHAILLATFFKEWGRMLWQRESAAKEQAFLSAAYRLYLHREPDTEGKRFYLKRLQSRSFGYRDVLWSIQQSQEFKLLSELQVNPLDVLHSTRMQLVQNHLPMADRILDLGGASRDDPEGALLAMGYPYTPKEIIIVDLPVDQRLGTWENEEPDCLETSDGTRIRYLFGSMADLSPIADNSVDLVFSGESIEHVSEADADRVIEDAYRVLRPGGYFCLDTPNRAMTKLHSPEALIHPEHQKEYFVDELAHNVESHGFNVVEAKSICPLPRAFESGQFEWAELVGNGYIGDTPEEGYLFFLKCRKPL